MIISYRFVFQTDYRKVAMEVLLSVHIVELLGVRRMLILLLLVLMLACCRVGVGVDVGLVLVLVLVGVLDIYVVLVLLLILVWCWCCCLACVGAYVAFVLSNVNDKY